MKGFYESGINSYTKVAGIRDKYRENMYHRPSLSMMYVKQRIILTQKYLIMEQMIKSQLLKNSVNESINK